MVSRIDDALEQPLVAEPAAPNNEVVETRSIDYVPRSERYGRVRDLGPVWFSANAQLATIATGLIGIAAGGTFVWTMVALILGLAFGTLFMAFHSAQGPRMGLPQMIQSRAQFGYLGAIIPLAVVLILYVGFNVFNVILAAQALQVALHWSLTLLLVIVTALAVLVAVFGYVWIHRVQRWLTYLFVAGFGIFTVAVLFTVHPASSVMTGGFKAVPFFLQFAVAASYQISLAPYVSDYSRYLPEGVSSRATFWWTYAPSLVSALWLTGLGALLQASYPKLQPVDAIHAAGNSVFGGFGIIGLLIAVPGTITITAMNTYGGALTSISALDSLKSIKPTRVLRVAAVVLVGIVSFVIAKTASGDFLTNFGNFLTFLLYFLIPWTAVNLVDFYFVRRGKYEVAELFKVRGIYGRIGWRGVLAYIIGFGVMVPFFSTTIYTGPIANSISGVDLSIFVGLPVSAAAYLLLVRLSGPSELPG